MRWLFAVRAPARDCVRRKPYFSTATSGICILYSAPSGPVSLTDLSLATTGPWPVGHHSRSANSGADRPSARPAARVSSACRGTASARARARATLVATGVSARSARARPCGARRSVVVPRRRSARAARAARASARAMPNGFTWQTTSARARRWACRPPPCRLPCRLPCCGAWCARAPA